ncbi:uncharacterized protein V1518DRAFT_425554 [Limtongia smithiae]|uniref:uncharacterized protein n=1 Tax=Limtongia smithiae TaxID=1125753 RepID=UPI0034CDCC39
MSLSSCRTEESHELHDLAPTPAGDAPPYLGYITTTSAASSVADQPLPSPPAYVATVGDDTTNTAARTYTPRLMLAWSNSVPSVPSRVFLRYNPDLPKTTINFLSSSWSSSSASTPSEDDPPPLTANAPPDYEAYPPSIRDDPSIRAFRTHLSLKERLKRAYKNKTILFIAISSAFCAVTILSIALAFTVGMN